jgi:uncharacterized repeat protein (TIGR01451 family)
MRGFATPGRQARDPHSRDGTIMNRKWLLWALAVTVALQPSGGTRHDGIDSRPATALTAKTGGLAPPYGKLALSFEANVGQADPEVKFLSRGRELTVWLSSTEAVLSLRTSTRSGTPEKEDAHGSAPTNSSPQITRTVLRTKLLHANPAPRVVGIDEQPGRSHYFIGNDPTRWRTNIPNYAGVRYHDVYPGVDLAYYGNAQQLEYDFIVQPGADPRRIAIAFRGARRISIDDGGDLVLQTAAGEIRHRRPLVYQETDGVQQRIESRFVLRGHDEVGFQLAQYDPTRPLVIDPTLAYATFHGGSEGDTANGIAVDAAGNAYITGETASLDLPVTDGAFQIANSGSTDVFVTKLDPTGSVRLYSTYIGGSNVDRGNSIGLDAAGNAYVTGRVASIDFPTTVGAFRRFFGGDTYDAFVSKLNPDGSALVYSTYLGGGGNDSGFGLAVDAAGSAYVTGGTTSEDDFPVTVGVFQPLYGGGVPGNDAFVTKLNGAGSTLEYSSYLGGSFNDRANGIAVDSAGNAYVTGWTDSPDFPIAAAFQPANNGGQDAYVTKVNSDGSNLLYSTFLGGGGNDGGLGIAVDMEGNSYLIGYTESINFPTMNAFQPAIGGGRDAFVTKFNSDGSALVFSTYLGGASEENLVGPAVRVGGIAVDASGSAHVTGATRSSNFPTQNPVQLMPGGGLDDAFVSRFDPTGTTLSHSTYLGGSLSDFGTGIAVQSSGQAFVTGQTSSSDFPTVNALQPTAGGGTDAFVALIVDSSTAADLSVTKMAAPNPVMPGSDITYSIEVTNLGPDAGASAAIHDNVPADTTYQFLLAPADWSCTTPEVGATGPVTCTGAPLEPGATAALALFVRVNETVAGGTVISNTAAATSSTPDPTPDNNSATTTVTVAGLGGEAADIAVALTAWPDPVSPGADLIYPIEVANLGPSAAVAPTVTDDVPADTTYQFLVAPADWSCTTPEVGATGPVTCTGASLEPGATAALALFVRVNETVAGGTVISNTAAATSSTPDPTPDNNSATTTVTVASSGEQAWNGQWR